jgi:hypothetical protein
MQAVINDKGVKIFTQAIHYLGKCGKEISFEASPTEVRLGLLSTLRLLIVERS